MPRIVRAGFLSYYNARRNSDKLFNVFVIEDDDGTFRCVTEHGRRGTNLVRGTLCVKASRELAMSKLRQKLASKRDHRETPYTDEPLGSNYSRIAGEYDFGTFSNASVNLSPSDQSTSEEADESKQPKQNIIAFPAAKRETPRQKPKQAGILNKEQFDSLEI